MKLKFLILSIFCLSIISQAQENLLQSGPMVAYSTMKEVMLWAQTTEASNVHFVYWDTDAPKKKYESTSVLTKKDNGFIAKAVADKLEPGNTYNYQLYINNKLVKRSYLLEFQSQPIWKWRHDAPDYSFALGSCAYINETQYDRPGTPYGSNYQIFESINKSNPDFMLWLGDNVYLREADWNSKTGILHRFSHTRALPEMQPMLANMHHFGIWDDHDFGPNNSDRSYHLKKVTEQAFKDFFPSPNYIFDNGITSYVQWADADFFLLDNRYWRTPNRRTDLEREILGDEQLEWLIDALVNSFAPFKFVVMGGQFLNPAKHGEAYSKIAPEERQKIIDAILELKIRGVIFLTGDVHRTELTKMDMPNGYPLYDLTVSPLTSGVSRFTGEENNLQVENTVVNKHNYGLLKVFGTRDSRTLEINIMDANGELQWQKQIPANELTFKE